MPPPKSKSPSSGAEVENRTLLALHLLEGVTMKQLSSKCTEQNLVNFVGVKPLRRNFANHVWVTWSHLET